jgi:hypothetical protein
MKHAYFVSLLLLAAAACFGQSVSSLRPNRPHASPNPSRLPELPPFAQVEVRRVSERSTSHPQSAGLNFAPVVTYPSGGYRAISGAVADVNGDGKLDFVVANAGGSVSILLGNGDGTFRTPATYSTGGNLPDYLVIADVNGDGRLDLVVANECGSSALCTSGTVGVLLGNGDGTFQAAVTYDSGGYAAQFVAVADVNGDGKPDVLVANGCFSSSDCTYGTVGVLLGSGDGTFQTAVTYNSGGIGIRSVAVGDVNGDDKPDLVVTNECANGDCTYGTVGVLLGNGDGTFQIPVLYSSGGNETSLVTIADVNADGNPDLLVTNGCFSSSDCTYGTVGVLAGNGDGTFQTAVTYASGDQDTWSIALADVNGDGMPDIVVTNVCATDSNCAYGTVSVLLGNGDGTFQAAMTYGSGGNETQSVSVGDLNGDGKPDLLVANCTNNGSSLCDNNSSPGVVGVLLNTSTGSTATALASSLNPSNFGQAVTFTAAVTSLVFKGTPTGAVTFLDGTTTLGTSSLNSSGVATLSAPSLTIGTHSITAAYGGDPNFAASTSQVLSQVVQGAIVQLNPPSVNFGNVTVGGNGVMQGVLVNLTNTGNIALTISSIAITGANSGDFIQTNLCPSSLAPNGACTITVQFIPTTTGKRTGALTITDNAANSPQSVSLTGVGVLPAVSLAPATLSFPTQVVFTNSKTQTVTLNNTGLGYLFITNVAVSGPFTQTNNCGSTVNPGSSCTFTVAFKPTKAGLVTGALSITDNAPLSPQTVSLKGTGTYVQFNPVSFNFGNQPVGTKSLPKKITLSNKGNVPVSITKISLTGANAADFSETNTCATRVAAGASCFITVTFTPSARGLRSASVTVVDNGGGSPQTVGVAGTGT